VSTMQDAQRLVFLLCVRFEAFFGAERDSDCSGLRGA
jgi:hypothetical protein